MNWQLCIFISIILCVIGFLAKKSKIISYIQIFWMILLMGGNCNGMDYNVHLMYYTSAINARFGDNAWLYKFICKPFAINGFEFYVCNMVITLVLMFMLYKCIKRKTKNVSMVLSLMFIFPFVDCIIQKRNFCASVILIIGVILFLEKNRKRDLFITVLLSAQIHPSFYMYLIILPIIFLKKNYKAFLCIGIVVAFLGVFYIPKLSQILLGGTVYASKINLYFVQLKIPLYQAICWMLLHIIFVCAFYYIYENSKRNCKDENVIKQLDLLKKINSVTLLYMPFYYYEPTFFRLFRNILIVNYIYYAVCSEKYFKSTKNNFIVALLFVIYLILIFVTQYVLLGYGFDILVKPLLENNFFWL